jgi:hypothetical protein
MSFHITAGPPGSGKTTRLLQLARNASEQGRRVLWVGLPAQRAWLYRQATAQGGLLGFEFISSQQLCYRLLGRALQLRPLRTGTERLALVVQALLEVRGELPVPGEARLFSAAIAELKRFGLSPADMDIAAGGGELDRLQDVFHAYEHIKGAAWDYDDYRLGAVHLAEAGLAQSGASLLIVDGYRELLPLELRLYRALGTRGKTTGAAAGEAAAAVEGTCEVHVALPEAPAGLHADVQLTAARATGASATRISVFRAENEVAEARWIMRSLKADLARGADPLDLALVLPEGETSAYAALAGEYGVPLMDETARTLADTRAGRLLLDLLAFPDYPTASGLLALPGLERLASAAFERRVAGSSALLELARELDAEDSAAAFEALEVVTGTMRATDEPLTQEQLLRDWLARLEVPDDTTGWAAQLVELAAAEALKRQLATAGELADFRDQALQRAREAHKLAGGARFREWWATLLSEAWLPVTAKAGVALLTPKLASGRNYRKAYVGAAVEGSYGAFETEDYFVNEELRATVLRDLPRRYRGSDAAVHGELLSMAAELVITWPESSQGGPKRPELALTGEASSLRLPELPAGSPLELGDGVAFAADFSLPASSVSLRKASVEDLRHYGQCPYRYWAQGLVQRKPQLTWWQQLRRDLRRQQRHDDTTLAGLAARYPQAAAWLERHAAALQQLTFDVTLPAAGVTQARIDGAGRIDGQPALYRFAAPASIANARQANEHLKTRWAERWAAAYLLGWSSARAPERVHLFVWPLLGEPVEAGRKGGLHAGAPFLEDVGRHVKTETDRFAAGIIVPQPDPYRCRNCDVFDFCRAGTR